MPIVEEPGPLASRFEAFGIKLPWLVFIPRWFLKDVIEKLELLQANVERQIAETEKSAAMNLRLVQELTAAKQELVQNRLNDTKRQS